jgi:hypothetical protein
MLWYSVLYMHQHIQYIELWYGMIWYSVLYMHQYIQYTELWYGMVWYSVLYMHQYNRLPEDEPSVSERVQDIKKLKIKILI